MSLALGSIKAVSHSTAILVVEDFEPFRRLICIVLRDWSQDAIIYETADGLECVEKALWNLSGVRCVSQNWSRGDAHLSVPR
jgi:hypothetical protein